MGFVEQLGGISYVYATDRDDTTKVTIQPKGYSAIGNGAEIEVGIESGAAMAFDSKGHSELGPPTAPHAIRRPL